MSRSAARPEADVRRVAAPGHLNSVRLSRTGALIPNVIAWVLAALLTYYTAAFGADAPIRINGEVVPPNYNPWILLAAGGVVLSGIVFGALLMREAIRQHRRYRDLGASILELQAAVAPGDRLVGTLNTGINPRQAPPDGFQMQLAYVRYRPSVSDESGGERTILWRNEKWMAAEEGSTESLSVPVAFDLPTRLPAPEPDKNATTYWRLTVRAALPERSTSRGDGRLPGGSFYTAMKVPVEERERPDEQEAQNERERPAPVSPKAASYEIDPPERPPSPGIEVRRMASSIEVHFHPRLRQTKAVMDTFAVLIGTGMMAVGVNWMFFQEAGACSGFFLTLFAGVITVPFGKSAFMNWFYSYSIRIAGGEVVIRSGLARWPTETRLHQADLASIGVRTTDKTYGIALHGRGDDRWTIPAHIPRKDEAERIARQLAEAARLPLARSA